MKTEPRMKIALLTDKYPPDPGGVARSSERLGSLLAAAGHTVHVFAPTAGDVPGRLQTTACDRVVVHRIGQSRQTDATNADFLDAVTAERTGFDVLHGTSSRRRGSWRCSQRGWRACRPW